MKDDEVLKGYEIAGANGAASELIAEWLHSCGWRQLFDFTEDELAQIGRRREPRDEARWMNAGINSVDYSISQAVNIQLLQDAIKYLTATGWIVYGTTSAREAYDPIPCGGGTRICSVRVALKRERARRSA